MTNEWLEELKALSSVTILAQSDIDRLIAIAEWTEWGQYTYVGPHKGISSCTICGGSTLHYSTCLHSDKWKDGDGGEGWRELWTRTYLDPLLPKDIEADECATTTR